MTKSPHGFIFKGTDTNNKKIFFVRNDDNK